MSQVAARRLTEPSPFHFTVDDYYMLAEIGVLGENTRTELIEGEIIEMPPSSPEHSGHVDAVTDIFHGKLQSKYRIRCQMAVRVSQITEPEPDIAVFKARADKYTKSHPTPADALLVVEVSKSTLDYDLKRKAGIYAKAGIKEYWVLDLNARRLHVFTRPVGGIWKQHRTLTPREEVQSATVPELKLKVSELFV